MAFLVQCSCGAVTGVYLIITGQGGKLLQGGFYVVPVTGGEVCSAAGALEERISAENNVTADKADASGGMSGGFQNGKGHIADGHGVTLPYLYIGVDDDRAADKLRAVQGRVGEQGHFLRRTDNRTAQSLLQLIDRADMVIMSVGQQDMADGKLILVDIIEQGGNRPVAVDDAGVSVIVGNDIVIRADRAGCVASNFHFKFLLGLFPFVFQDYSKDGRVLQSEKKPFP